MTGLDAAEVARRTEAANALTPILAAMDVRAVRLGRGVAEAEIPLGPNGNHFGVMYAGSLFTVAEVLGGYLPAATWDLTGYLPIVADMQISYRAPATTTVRARASLDEAELARIAAELEAGAPKIRFTLSTVLTDTAGTSVATTTGSYLLRRLPDADA
ncbi:hypothetical protein GCM10011584_33660 [Nocardioides phosphati]|uniref:DUF4442 domain-containing protein n=1 Tax=Nocardioides phosphati TaxID=1867775 RepID=A0ABQ2NDK0_9ACTN|nr:YiiD C-terminal domain-containing protein [Nocardioides phosphati]GGO93900.1 hypothetical protein GCM10011584_33660 [Nocardioides phosphati]